MGGVKEALWIDVPQGNNSRKPDLKLIGQHPYPQTDHSGYAEVGTQNMSSFHNTRKDTVFANPTPYATTILLNTMVPNNRSEISVSNLNYIQISIIFKLKNNVIRYKFVWIL